MKDLMGQRSPKNFWARTAPGHAAPLPKISAKSIRNFFEESIQRTDEQTERQTENRKMNTDKNISSFPPWM